MVGRSSFISTLNCKKTTTYIKCFMIIVAYFLILFFNISVIKCYVNKSWMIAALNNT